GLNAPLSFGTNRAGPGTKRPPRRAAGGPPARHRMATVGRPTPGPPSATLRRVRRALVGRRGHRGTQGAADDEEIELDVTIASGRRLGTLASLPGLRAEWHETRNDGLSPDEVSVGSSRRVWWRCAAGHEWQARIGNRAR